MESNMSLCEVCAHNHGQETDVPAEKRQPGQCHSYFFCDAFPDGTGIPHEIYFGHQRHIKPVEGDHGIQFEWDEEKKKNERLVKYFKNKEGI